MHRLEDKTLVTPALLQRFSDEAPDGRFYAYLQRSDGSYLTHNVGPELTTERIIFAQDILRFLNKELACDGAWVICYTNPVPPALPLAGPWEYDRFALIFLDRDGDPQFTVEWEANDGDMLDFADVMLAGRETWGNLCQAALEAQRYLMKDVLDPREGDTYRRALGEKAPSTVH